MAPHLSPSMFEQVGDARSERSMKLLVGTSAFKEEHFKQKFSNEGGIDTIFHVEIS